jgi:hypothetical protein
MRVIYDKRCLCKRLIATLSRGEHASHAQEFLPSVSPKEGVAMLPFISNSLVPPDQQPLQTLQQSHLGCQEPAHNHGDSKILCIKTGSNHLPL